MMRKVLETGADGLARMQLTYLPAGFTLPDLPYRHTHTSVHEFSYTLWGELPHWEYESAAQARGVQGMCGVGMIAALMSAGGAAAAGPKPAMKTVQSKHAKVLAKPTAVKPKSTKVAAPTAKSSSTKMVPKTPTPVATTTAATTTAAVLSAPPAGPAPGGPGYSQVTAAPLGSAAPIAYAGNPRGWDMKVNSVVLDGTQQLTSANPGLTPPAAGRQFVLVNVTVTWSGTQVATAAQTFPIYLQLVGDSGSAADLSPFRVTPGIITAISNATGDVAPGTSLSGYMCYSLLSSDGASATLVFRPIANYRTWFAIR